MENTKTTPTASLDLRGGIYSRELRAHSPQGFLEKALSQAYYHYFLLLIDVLVIVSLFILLSWNRYGGGLVEVLSRRVLLVLIAGNVFGLYLIGGYNRNTHKGIRFVSEHIIVSLVVTVGTFALIYAVVTYGLQHVNRARSVVVLVLVTFPVLSIAYRLLLERTVRRSRDSTVLCVIGLSEATRGLWRQISRIGKRHERVEYYDVRPELSGQKVLADDLGSPVVRPLSDLTAAEPDGSWEFVVDSSRSAVPEDLLRQLIGFRFQARPVANCEDYLQDNFGLVAHETLSSDWVFSSGFRLGTGVSYRRLKRIMDLLISVLALLILSPVFLLVSVAVLLSSRGKVIFRQQRTGLNEKAFTALKFRSMKERAPDQQGDPYTRANDSRLTPIGGFLRKSRLDELPQLWNVLRGEMSLIGPRAEWVDLVSIYEEQIPCYHLRHLVKPGITGWAQVCYPYGQSLEDAKEKLNYDLHYVKNCSLWMDLSIVVKTIYVMLSAKGR